jgi:hypothetical protein
MNRFDKWLENNKWVLLPILYVIICVWTYFGTTVTIEGYELPRSDAGVYGVIGLHIIGFIAVLGAYLLHVIVELVARIFK